MFLDRLLDRVKDETGVSFKEFRDFCQFLNNLEDFSIAMRMYTLVSFFKKNLVNVTSLLTLLRTMQQRLMTREKSPVTNHHSVRGEGVGKNYCRPP